MKRRPHTRSQQKQINILHTTTRKRHSRQAVTHLGFWAAVVLAMIAVVGVTLHFGVGLLLNHALYSNSRYVLKKIEIEPAGHFTEYPIRQATGLEPGENLWTLNLPQITRDLEKLPYVSSAKVERRFPDRVVIHIVERVPVVKIVGINIDLGTRETFYLDRECIVLKPRRDEALPPLPEIIGLSNAELEPGVKLEEPSLVKALEILNAIDHTSTLHTSIDIRSIDLSQPLDIKMVTTRDMTITFRPEYIDQQLVRLVAIFDRYGNDQQRTLRTIDLTPDQNVPITFYE
jgi:cell division septal protein FtsQ